MCGFYDFGPQPINAGCEAFVRSQSLFLLPEKTLTCYVYHSQFDGTKEALERGKTIKLYIFVHASGSFDTNRVNLRR